MPKQLEIFPPDQDFSASLNWRYPVENQALYKEGMIQIFGLDPQNFVDGFSLAMLHRAAPDVVKLDNYLQAKHGGNGEKSLNEIVAQHYPAGVDWLDKVL